MGKVLLQSSFPSKSRLAGHLLLRANVICFKGRRLEAFDPKQTRSTPFHLSATQTLKAPTMHQAFVSVDEADTEVPAAKALIMQVSVPPAVQVNRRSTPLKTRRHRSEDAHSHP